jgi:hypothetical protein
MTPHSLRSDGWVPIIIVATLLAAIAAALEWGGVS